MLYLIAVINSLVYINSLIAVLLSNLLGMPTFIVLAIFYISLSLFSSIIDCAWWIVDPGDTAVMAVWSFVFLKISLITAFMFLIVMFTLCEKCRRLSKEWWITILVMGTS